MRSFGLRVDALRKTWLAGVGLTALTVGLGLGVIYPTTLTASPSAWRGVVAVAVILSLYGLAGWFGLPRLDAGLLPIVMGFGLAASLVFVTEIALEYWLLPPDNTPYGYVEFGAVFALYLLAGLSAAWRTGRLRPGLTAALGSAVLASLVWYLAVLTITYLFAGSARQQLVFQAEGNYADFARSGLRDFNAFIMEDFLGAGFFHLLLVPLLAALLGGMGGLLGRGLARLQRA